MQNGTLGSELSLTGDRYQESSGWVRESLASKPAPASLFDVAGHGMDLFFAYAEMIDALSILCDT